MGKEIRITVDDTTNGGLVRFLKSVQKLLLKREASPVIILAVTRGKDAGKLVSMSPKGFRDDKILQAVCLEQTLQSILASMTPEELEEFQVKAYGKVQKEEE